MEPSPRTYLTFEVREGKLRITEEGKIAKFVNQVEQLRVAPSIDPVKDVVEKADSDIRVAADLKKNGFPHF